MPGFFMLHVVSQNEAGWKTRKKQVDRLQRGGLSSTDPSLGWERWGSLSSEQLQSGFSHSMFTHLVWQSDKDSSWYVHIRTVITLYFKQTPIMPIKHIIVFWCWVSHKSSVRQQKCWNFDVELTSDLIKMSNTAQYEDPIFWGFRKNIGL